MIHLVLGSQGSGKTLFLVKKAFEYARKGKVVYSNVHLNFKFQQLDYQEIVNCKLKNSVVILDEVHLLLPARNSLSSRNRIICDNFLSMARKQNTQIFGSTQTSRKVDIRFREEADYVYTCVRRKYDPKSKRWVEIMHNQNLDPKIPIMIDVEVLQVQSKKIINLYFRANPFYKLYNTFEVVKIIGID